MEKVAAINKGSFDTWNNCDKDLVPEDDDVLSEYIGFDVIINLENISGHVHGGMKNISSSYVTLVMHDGRMVTVRRDAIVSICQSTYIFAGC